jgi:CRISPR/Cas system endoribonuclease Cas6 (RAMP superfamily)
VERYSRRQHGSMTFGGWMGRVEYAAGPARWMPLLRAARLLHVGKHTDFGFGEVRLA